MATSSSGVELTEAHTFDNEFEEELATTRAEEGGTKWDWVFTFNYGEKDRLGAHRKSRGELVRSLRKMKLIVRKRLSRDKDEVFVRVAAPQNVLEEYAERMELEMKLIRTGVVRKHDNPGYAIFTQARKHEFQGAGADSFFTSLERQQIIQYVIESRKNEGGAGVNIGEWVKGKRCNQGFPLHDNVRRKELLRSWAKAGFTVPQPLEDIKEYYGEQIALYFAWLAFYTKFLIPAAVFGLGVFIAQLATINSKNWDLEVTPFYCIFLALWATVFLELWKRRNSVLAYQWDVVEFELVERTRPEFVGEPSRGYYFGDVFIADEKGPFQYYYDYHRRKTKFTAAGVSVLFMVATVVVATLAIMALRVTLRTEIGSSGGGIVGGAINAIFIGVSNNFYRKVATKLCDWENHRTATAYEDALIVKVFTFQFVNSYISLYYIAFFKKWGGIFWADQEECTPNCFTELTIQLGSIFITQMVIGQAREVGLPWLKGALKLMLETRNMVKEMGASMGITKAEARKKIKEKKVCREERESKLPAYASTFDDYNEMAIQFGFVTLFAAAFPVTSLLALINNVIEVRSDALKILMGMQRPQYKGAKDIGTWYNVLEFLGVVAVMTNMAIVGFTSNSLVSLKGSIVSDDSTPGSYGGKLIVVVVAEHLILLLKYLIATLIPDTPGWVREKLAERTYTKERRQEAIDAAEEFPEWVDRGGDDSDTFDE